MLGHGSLNTHTPQPIHSKVDLRPGSHSFHRPSDDRELKLDNSGPGTVKKTYKNPGNWHIYNFTVRVISLRKSLPTHVITAVSVDSFKNRLDKFWAKDEACFDGLGYFADLRTCGPADQPMGILRT